MQQELCAIWTYDTFPYFLIGEIETVTAKGNIVPKRCSGYAFKPLCIFPKETGLLIEQQVQALAAEYHQKCYELKKDYMQKIESVIGMQIVNFDDTKKSTQRIYR